MKNFSFSSFLQFLKSFWNRWTLIAFVFACYSVVLQKYQPGILHVSNLTFFASLALSITFWNVIGGLVNLLPKSIALVLIAVIALLIPGLFVIGTKSFLEFKTFLDSNVLMFAKDDPDYFTVLTKVHFNDTYHLLTYLALSAFIFFILVYKKKFGHRNLVPLVFSALLFGIGQNQFGKYGIENFTTMDARYTFTLKKYFREKDEILERRKVLTKSYFRNEAQEGESSNYNIVLIFQESMSKEPIPIFGYDNDFMPFLQNWYKDDTENFVLFNDAMTISGCTDVSMPSTFTGAEPESSYEKFMKMPFMWDYAKANGYHTSFITPQQFKWKEFAEYYKNKNLDFVFSSEDSGLEFTNDLGVDDAGFSFQAKGVIEDKLKNKPFFMVYGSNALHYPYQGKSEHIEIPSTITDHYGKSLYIIDKSMNNLYEAIDNLNALDNTIFIFTSDHGQYTSERLSRLGSFYLEALQIPMFIKFPKSWVQENPEKFQAIKKNTESRVTNLDLLPTFLDIIKSSESNKLYIENMKGTSLFQPIDNDRTVVCLSTNEFRMWTHEGLGIYRDSMSYIIDNVFKEQLYNVYKDPNQQHNLIGKGKHPFLEEVYERIDGNKNLKRIYDEYVK